MTTTPTPAAGGRSGFSLREVTPDDAQLLLDWRTKPRITRFSITDIPYDLEAQHRWLESCYHRSDYYHWIVEVDGRPVGTVNLDGYDRAARGTAWGFCIGSDDHVGLGALIPPCFYNFAFAHLGVDRINGETFFNNTGVLELHRLHGYRFTPAQDRVIVKHKREVLLVAQQLDRAAWDQARYQRFNAAFPTERWTARPASLGQAGAATPGIASTVTAAP